MSDADRAFAKAQEKILKAIETGARALDFSDSAFRNLGRLPPEIAKLTGLQTLHLNDTQVTDLAPLAELVRLKVLNLDNTRVTDISPLASLKELLSLQFINIQAEDLRPIAGLSKLGTQGIIGHRGGCDGTHGGAEFPKHSSHKI